MAVTAVNTNRRHVVLVTEWNGLLARNAGLRDIAGPVHRDDYRKNAGNDKNRTKDAELRKCVSASVEDL